MGMADDRMHPGVPAPRRRHAGSWTEAGLQGVREMRPEVTVHIVSA